MSTFRRVPPSQFERYQALLDYAFRLDEGPRDDEVAPPAGPGEWWALFESEAVLTTATLYDLDARIRGEWARVGGLAGVSTPPEHRRRGYAGEMIDGALREWRDRAVPWVALWPFDIPFYRQFGWGVANRYTRYEFPPSALSALLDADSGRFERVTADDWARLRRVQLAHGEGTTLSIRREERWWRQRTFQRGGDPYAYAWTKDGEVRGYLIYHVVQAEQGRVLRVFDCSHVDHEAYRHLLRFLYDHESQVSIVRLYRREETSLQDLVEDPKQVTCQVETGPMIRLCDVRTALSRMSFPDGLDERVVLDVADDVAPWNDLTVALRVGTDITDCARTKLPPDASVGIRTLSQLAIGYYDVETARCLGDLECEEETAAALERLFPPQRVCLREFF